MLRSALGSLLAVTILAGCGGNTKTVIIQTHIVTVTSSGSQSSTSSATSSGTTSASSSHIYFYAVFGVSTQPEERPAKITFPVDGSNWITDLHWHGWGDQVAASTGIDYVNTCVPNCGQAPIQRVRAKVTIYRPGQNAGRHMYLCYRLAFLAPSPIRGFSSCDTPDRPGTGSKCGQNTFYCPVEVDCPMATSGGPSSTGCYGVVGVSGDVAMPTPGPDRTGLKLNCPWSRPRLTTDQTAYAYVCDPGP